MVHVRRGSPRDALSNVLFISVEQSLPVYPEDISVCTQRRNASQRPRVAHTRPLNAVASNIMTCCYPVSFLRLTIVSLSLVGIRARQIELCWYCARCVCDSNETDFGSRESATFRVSVSLFETRNYKTVS